SARPRRAAGWRAGSILCSTSARTAVPALSSGTDIMAETNPHAQKAFPVSWDQFHRDARALAWRLAEAGPFAAIVCITRGGLVPAAIVARELGIRIIETVCVASYDHVNQGELKVLKTVAANIAALVGGRGKGFLVVVVLL